MSRNVKEMFSETRGAHLWDAMYDGPADTFDKYIFRSRRDYAVDTVRELVDEQGYVLDLGCGAGPFSSEILKYDYNVFSTDYSADILVKARERLQGCGFDFPTLSQSDSQKQPFQDKSFNAVVCLGVISYVPNRKAAIEEMYRVLKENGLLIVTFRNFYNPTIYDPVNLIQYLFGKTSKSIHCERNGEFVPGAFLKPQEIRRMLESTGFKIIRCKGIGRGPIKLKRRTMLPVSLSVSIDKLLEKLLTAMGFNNSFHGADVAMFVCQKAQSGDIHKHATT